MSDLSAPSGDDFSLWTVWRRDPQRPVTTDDTAALAAVVDELAASGVTIRGFYDVSAMRADADLMIWLHGPVAEDLQAATRRLRRTELLAPLVMSWSGMAVHRDSEFNKAHIPGYLRGEHARDWLVVYPFVRSYDWYLLPDDERRKMLADHGRKGAAFKSVVANTMPAFALGDYEWMLPMESDSLTDLVDMMRDLRYTDARLHVRDELPFHTGRRIAVDEVAEVIR
ncbi:MAG TPA: chlorite dismutase family protein [Candidatus Microbacterium stercoravium]|uniref:Coproheme decarboxylase n=1 Tax=Candidatus Microbacterium stercoravium TaxID=2838697 RepID=A0A9D2KGQ7_9MICO|nr:chlorite dismutase family protein [Candidatus Microbacterium stercoravium]